MRVCLRLVYTSAQIFSLDVKKHTNEKPDNGGKVLSTENEEKPF